MCQDERIKEACGVFGIYNPHGEDAASSIYYGLSSLPRTDEPRECFTEFSFVCSTVDRNPAESLCLTPAVPREI